MNDAAIRETFRGKSVLVTGHTGFRGSWLTLWLHDMGARVTGYSLAPPTCSSTLPFESLPHGYDHKYVYSHIGFNLKPTDLHAAAVKNVWRSL